MSNAGILVVIEVRNGDVHRSKLAQDAADADDILVTWAEEVAEQEGLPLTDEVLDDIHSGGFYQSRHGTIRQVWLREGLPPLRDGATTEYGSVMTVMWLT